MGEIPIRVPQDRNSDFEPQVVPKYKRDISEIEGKIIGRQRDSKGTAYVILGINEEGRKEVLSITVGENESAKFWLSVLKNRGAQDLFVICADGLSSIRDAIEAAYPLAGYQRCIVHMVRNTLKYVSDKDRKAFATT